MEDRKSGSGTITYLVLYFLFLSVYISLPWLSSDTVDGVQGRTQSEGQYRSDYGHQHPSGTRTVSAGGRRGWGNGGGVMRGQGGGYGEGGGGGEGGGRMAIRDLVPHQPNSVSYIGTVYTYIVHVQLYMMCR